MFCTQCGTNVPEDSQFCSVCGCPINQDTGVSGAGRAAGDAEEAERLARLQREQAKALQAERERVLESYEASRNVETTPVAQVLDDGRVAYEPLSDVGGMASTKDVKAELKEAKAAYKDARKAAGKSSAPKVIAIIVAILIAAGVGAGAMWWLSGQQSGPAPAPSSSNPSASDGTVSAEPPSENSSSISAPSAPSASTQGGIESYVGIWKGDMVEPTHYWLCKTCYGAEGHPLVLDIKNVSGSGHITADASVLFHEHESLGDADAATTDGDTYIDLHDLDATLSSDGEFSFHKKLVDRGEFDEVTITVKTVDAADGTRTLEATVESKVLGGHAADLYVLEKQ